MAKGGINKVIIVGNLGADPETRYTPSGTAVANLRVATTETWRDSNSGEQKEQTEWHRVVLFNKLAEIAGEYLKKGAQIYLEGKLQTRKWQDQQGNDRFATEIIGRDMQMLGGGGGQGGQGNRQDGQQQAGQSGQSQQQSPAPATAGGGGGGGWDDDIPFAAINGMVV